MSGINGGPNQQAANWRYDVPNGDVSRATYPGDVQVDGDLIIPGGTTVQAELNARPTYPCLQDYDNQGDTTSTTQIQRYLSSDAGNGLPLLMNEADGIVIGETIQMTPGAKFISPGGPLNVVTKFFPTPTAPGLTPIRLVPGFVGPAIEIRANCYDAYLEGLWLDLSNQVSGDGVDFSEQLIGGGTAAIIYRSGAVIRRCKIYNAAGRGIVVRDKHHEANFFNVLVQNTRGIAATYIEGGDITADQIWAQDSAQVGHYFKNASEIRIGHIEAWASGTNNFRIAGFTRSLNIVRLISDLAGEHGVLFAKEVGDTHLPDLVRILNGRSTTSSNKAGASNQFDDWHFSDGDGQPSGVSRIRISGLAGGPSAQPTRHNIGATIAANTNFRSRYDWRVEQFDFNSNSTVDGTPASIMNAAARSVIKIGSRVQMYNGVAPEPMPQTGLVGSQNLIQNGDFTAWSGSPAQPDGWLSSGGATLSLDAVNLIDGKPSLRIVAGASLDSGAITHVYMPQKYRGKRITLGLELLSPEAESAAFNTRVRVNAGSSSQSFLAAVSNAVQYVTISIDVAQDCTFISVLATPAGTIAQAGRAINIQNVAIVEGNQIPDVVPSNDCDLLGWHSVSLTPSGGNVALDARLGGSRYNVSLTGAGNFVGIVNAKPMQEILIRFADSNATLVTFFNLKRADGATAPQPIAAGTIVRAVWDGANFICTLPGVFVPPSRTITELPTSGGLEGGQWLCSNLGGDPGLVIYRAGKYQRVADGAPVDVANVTNVTLDWLANSNVIRLTGTLAADRVLTLDTARAPLGAVWYISRTGGGAFNWTIAGVAGSTIAQNQTLVVRLGAGGLVITDRGSLV